MLVFIELPTFGDISVKQKPELYLGCYLQLVFVLA